MVLLGFSSLEADTAECNEQESFAVSEAKVFLTMKQARQLCCFCRHLPSLAAQTLAHDSLS